MVSTVYIEWRVQSSRTWVLPTLEKEHGKIPPILAVNELYRNTVVLIWLSGVTLSGAPLVSWVHRFVRYKVAARASRE